MVPRLELRASWESFMSVACSPGAHRHCRRLAGWRGGKHSAEEHIAAKPMCKQTDLHCTPGSIFGSQVQLPRRPTSRLASAVPRGMGVVEKHTSVYKHLSKAASDPPKGSVPGIVCFPRSCQGIQMGAVCNCSSSVVHTSAEKGLNSITELPAHLL